MRHRWEELLAALVLLTRLPVGRLLATPPPASACVWAYPLVGAVVGGVGGAVLLLARVLGLSPPFAAVLALAATVLLTGALHEDGLADTADGFGGGRTRAAKLAIMRDSRIGSFGALALILSLALRAIPLAITPRPLLAMVTASVFGRTAMLLLLLLPAARPDGLAASVASASPPRLLIGLLLAAPLGALCPWAALLALAAAAITAWLARRQVGGVTGDVLGAAEQAAECAALACF